MVCLLESGLIPVEDRFNRKFNYPWVFLNGAYLLRCLTYR